MGGMSDQRRTTADLMDELNERASGAVASALVVAFAKTTKFIWSFEPDPLVTLNAYVNDGGEPVAFILHEGRTFRAEPVREHANDERVQALLITILADFREGLAEMGVPTLPLEVREGGEKNET
jgi:hypothetical protein